MERCCAVRVLRARNPRHRADVATLIRAREVASRNRCLCNPPLRVVTSARADRTSFTWGMSTSFPSMARRILGQVALERNVLDDA